MRKQSKCWLGIALLTLLAGPAWAERAGAPAASYITVTSGAVHLMPVPFQKILTQRQSHLLSGLNTSHPAPPPGGSDALIARIEGQVQSLRMRLSENVPFNSLVAEYGILARLIADLEDPSRSHAAAPVNAALHKEFHTLLEKKSAKLPTVFYGFDATLFQKRDVRSFLNGIAERARLAGERLTKTYGSEGRIKALADADDQSPAFGLAALYYSHAVSDVANIWLYIWWESYGDMRGTPFFDITAKP